MMNLSSKSTSRTAFLLALSLVLSGSMWTAEARTGPRKPTAEYYADLARVAVSQKQYAAAADYLKRAAELQGKSGQPEQQTRTYYSNLATIHLGAGQYEEALAAVKALQRLSGQSGPPQDNVQYTTALATVHMRHGQHQKAADLLQAACRGATDAQKPELLSLLATSQQAMGQQAEALKTAKSAVKLGGGFEARYRLLPLLLDEFIETDPKAAADLVRSAVNATPSIARKHQAAMRICFSPTFQKNRDVMKAIVGTIDDDSVGVRMLKAEIDAMDRKQMDRAIQTYKSILDEHPEELLPLQRLFFICQAAGDSRQALRYGRMLMEKLPPAQGRYMVPQLARVMAKAGKKEEAVKFLKDAHAASAEDRRLVTDIAKQLVEVGAQEEAVAIAEDALAKWRDEWYVSSRIADVLIKAGRREEGLKLLKSTLEKNPSERHLLYQAMNTYLTLGMKPEAMKTAQQMIDRAKSPRDKIRALMMAAQAAVRFKDTEAAAAFYEQVLALPNMSNSHRQAKQMLAYCKRKPQESPK